MAPGSFGGTYLHKETGGKILFWGLGLICFGGAGHAHRLLRAGRLGLVFVAHLKRLNRDLRGFHTVDSVQPLRADAHSGSNRKSKKAPKKGPFASEFR
jgi:hypothetical protein